MRRVVPIPFPTDPLTKDAAAFGAAVRAARTGGGLTLAEAAITLGVAKQTLSDLERGRGSVGLSTALQVARDLGVAVFVAPASDREPTRRAIMKAKSNDAPISGSPLPLVVSSDAGNAPSGGAEK